MGTTSHQHHHYHRHHQHQQGQHPIYIGSEPNSGVSWNKLSVCFCLRPPRQALGSSKQSQSLSQKQRQHRQPSPSFLHIRRHSSFSLPPTGGPLDEVLDNCFPPSSQYLSEQPPPAAPLNHDRCSVSDFTESETSSYFSISDDDEDKRIAEVGLFEKINISNDESKEDDRNDAGEALGETMVLPALMALSTKPPILTGRARSAGLPPLNPSLVQQQSNDSSFVNNRVRTNTGDFTRNSTFTRASANTNASRHRRNYDHFFNFCSNSISEIYDNNDKTRSFSREKQQQPKPPLLVSFQDRSKTATAGETTARPTALRLADRGASDVSALGFNDSFDAYHDKHEADIDTSDASEMYGDLLGLSYEAEHQDDDDDSGSPFAALRKEHKKKKKSTRLSKKKSKKEKSRVYLGGDQSRYLRKCPALDSVTDVLSGWCAVLNLDTKACRHHQYHHLIAPDHQFELQDICYLRATVHPAGRAAVVLHRSGGSIQHTFVVDRDWTIESREVNGRMGRAVIVRTQKMSLLILPVSMDDSFFSSGELVHDKLFRAIREQMFVRPGRFVSDKQMDAAMHVMFTIDSLVKQYGAS